MLCLCQLVLIFFFKQKTAYEMRISDWSSDVCSSDLHGDTPRNILAPSRIDEIICNGCQRVRFASPDIDLSIPISIACYPEINGRKKLRVACCPCPTPYQARAGHPIVQHLECSNQFGFEQRRSDERRVGKACVSTVRFG